MVRDLMSQAYSAMRYNRRRTALTMLGMAWGIATVVLLLAYGAGFGRAIDGHLRELGHAHHRRLSRTHLATGGRAKGGHARSSSPPTISTASPLPRRW